MSSTSPPPWYTSVPLWVPILVFMTTWPQHFLKEDSDGKKACLERHANEHDPAVIDTVERIKRQMDREVEQGLQGPLVRYGYRPHERGPLVAILVFVFRSILLLLDNVILGFLLWLIMDLTSALLNLFYADIKKNVTKWWDRRLKRPKNTEDIEMTAGRPSVTASRPPVAASPLPEPALLPPLTASQPHDFDPEWDVRSNMRQVRHEGHEDTA
jgi:hypothetical protein